MGHSKLQFRSLCIQLFAARQMYSFTPITDGLFSPRTFSIHARKSFEVITPQIRGKASARSAQKQQPAALQHQSPHPFAKIILYMQIASRKHKYLLGTASSSETEVRKSVHKSPTVTASDCSGNRCFRRSPNSQGRTAHQSSATPPLMRSFHLLGPEQQRAIHKI